MQTDPINIRDQGQTSTLHVNEVCPPITQSPSETSSGKPNNREKIRKTSINLKKSDNHKKDDTKNRDTNKIISKIQTLDQRKNALTTIKQNKI